MIVLGCIALLAQFACGSKDPHDMRVVPLVGGALASGMTLEEVRSAESLEGLDILVVNDTEVHYRTKPRESYPVVEVEIEGYDHLGIGGKLRLSFYDDLLAEAVFVPWDSAGYADAFLREYGIDLRTQFVWQPSSQLEVWTNAAEAPRRPKRDFERVGWRNVELVDFFYFDS